MPYANLQVASIISVMTLFIMSWDYVPSVARFLLRVTCNWVDTVIIGCWMSLVCAVLFFLAMALVL